MGYWYYCELTAVRDLESQQSLKLVKFTTEANKG